MPAANETRKGSRLFKKADDQVYVIFRFNQEDMLIVQNTCALQKKIIENYGGTVIGLVDKITIYECEQVKQGPEKALLLLEFNSEKSARLWLNSDPKFKQHDWPHVWNNVDVIILPLSYIPSADAKTFMLTEIKGKTGSDFQEAYVANTAALLDKMNIEHGVVARRGVDCERGCWIQKNSFVLMHRAHSIEQMDNFYYSPEYEKLKQYRQAVCNTETMVFVAKGVTEK